MMVKTINGTKLKLYLKRLDSVPNVGLIQIIIDGGNWCSLSTATM